MNQALEILRRLDLATADERPRRELDRIFDELVLAFGDLAEEDRVPVREAYNRCACWATHGFWTSHTSYFLRFGDGGRPQDLRWGLAHYALSDGFPDPRDAIVALGELVVMARRHGVEHEPIAREIAAMSSPLDHGFGSMKTLMASLG